MKKGGRGGGGEGEVPFLGGWVVCLMEEVWCEMGCQNVKAFGF